MTVGETRECCRNFVLLHKKKGACSNKERTWSFNLQPQIPWFPCNHPFQRTKKKQPYGMFPWTAFEHICRKPPPKQANLTNLVRTEYFSPIIHASIIQDIYNLGYSRQIKQHHSRVNSYHWYFAYCLLNNQQFGCCKQFHRPPDE